MLAWFLFSGVGKPGCVLECMHVLTNGLVVSASFHILHANILVVCSGSLANLLQCLNHRYRQ